MTSFEIRVFNLLSVNIYPIFIIKDRIGKILGIYFMETIEEYDIPYIDCYVDYFKVINKKLEIYLDIEVKK